MKIAKLNHWSTELSDYNLPFVHIKGSNILADTISRIKTLDIYMDPLEYPKTCDKMRLQRCLPIDIKTLSIDRLPANKRRTLIVEIELHSHILKTKIASTH